MDRHLAQWLALWHRAAEPCTESTTLTTTFWILGYEKERQRAQKSRRKMTEGSEARCREKVRQAVAPLLPLARLLDSSRHRQGKKEEPTMWMVKKQVSTLAFGLATGMRPRESHPAHFLGLLQCRRTPPTSRQGPSSSRSEHSELGSAHSGERSV